MKNIRIQSSEIEKQLSEVFKIPHASESSPQYIYRELEIIELLEPQTIDINCEPEIIQTKIVIHEFIFRKTRKYIRTIPEQTQGPSGLKSWKYANDNRVHHPIIIPERHIYEYGYRLTTK